MKHAVHKTRSLVRLRLVMMVPALLTCAAARGQTAWELSPYRVTLVVAVENVGGFEGQGEDDLARDVAQRVAVVLGGVCKLSATAAEPAQRADILDPRRLPDAAAFAALADQQDKVVAIAVKRDRRGYRIESREYDGTIKRWLSVQSGRARQNSQLAGVAAETVLAGFSPLARIAFGPEGEVLLRPRAAQLAPRDGDWQMVRTGDVFQPVVRRSSYDDDSQSVSIESIDWTFLVAGRVDPLKVACQLVTGLRNPLAVSRGKRNERLAIAIRAPAGSTRLRLRSRSKPERPLVDYQIYDIGRSEREPDLVGLTDGRGEIDIGPGERRVRVLLVKRGRRKLARLPVVPGLAPRITAAVIDYDAELQVAAQVARLEDQLTDLVARREVLMARIRRRLEGGKLDDAARLLDDLKRLPNREEFNRQIVQLRARSSTTDPQTQARYDAKFKDVQALVDKYLVNPPIDRLHNQVQQARSG